MDSLMDSLMGLLMDSLMDPLMDLLMDLLMDSLKDALMDQVTLISSDLHGQWDLLDHICGHHPEVLLRIDEIASSAVYVSCCSRRPES